MCTSKYRYAIYISYNIQSKVILVRENDVRFNDTYVMTIML